MAGAAPPRPPPGSHVGREGAPSGDDDNRIDADAAVFVPDGSIGTVEDEMVHLCQLFLTITLSQMLEWTETLRGIKVKDHSNTPVKMMYASGADYKKRCAIQGSNFQRSKRLNW